VRYLYLNNGKLGSQVQCKICKRTSPTDKPRRESKAHYWCPHCGYALFRWKEDGLCTAFKCPNDHCPVYERHLAELTPEERAMRKAGNTSQFKLRYLFREYHFASQDLPLKRPENAPVDLNRIHHSLHTLGLCLTFSISLGLSARLTAQALERIFGICISHQTVINYIKAAACQLADFTDENSPVPEGTCAADETYIKIGGKTRYTWLVITETRRAICGYNLSETRGAEPALGLIQSMCGPPDAPKAETFELVTDGLPSYDSATVAYNTAVVKEGGEAILNKRTVIGLKNLDPSFPLLTKAKPTASTSNSSNGSTAPTNTTRDRVPGSRSSMAPQRSPRSSSPTTTSCDRTAVSAGTHPSHWLASKAKDSTPTCGSSCSGKPHKQSKLGCQRTRGFRLSYPQPRCAPPPSSGLKNNNQTIANTETIPIKSPLSTRFGVPSHLASLPSALS